MPSCRKSLSLSCFFCLTLWTITANADDFAAHVRHASLIAGSGGLMPLMEIDYQLSPTAKEALHKGVPLEWRVLMEIRQPGLLWNQRIYQRNIKYKLQFHALLNQYAVQNGNDRSEMFLTLNAALDYMAALHHPPLIEPTLLRPDHQYQFAIKTQFLRESLPVPLRPFAYLDPQWFLSSDWLIIPLHQ